VKEFCEMELQYIADVFKEDPKNYHAWSYRQWIILSVNDENIWKNELDYGTVFMFCNIVLALMLVPHNHVLPAQLL
jgi:Protein prenyltransferase alpha subunit repeat